MAKRRHAAKDEILLVPFLDILCSLIGVLVLIIVVLTVSQVQQTEGRTQEEVDRAVKYKELSKQQKQQNTDSEKVQELKKKLEQLMVEQKDKEERLAKIRKLLSTSRDVQQKNEQMSQALIKELDNLLLEIDGIKKQVPPLKTEIAELMAELKKRQIPPDKRPPPVMVQPSGSGTGNGKLFFVEASGGKLAFTIGGEKKTIAATEESIIGSAEFNHFLTGVKRDADSQLVFLLRTDGTPAFTRAGGWAQNKYAIRISRLLIPGQGDIDTSMFGDREGKVDALPADAANPAPAPAPAPK